MNDNLKKSDKVSCEASQGKTMGKVIMKQSSDTHIKGHKVKASENDPQMIVESEKSGKRAADKPGSLKKASAVKGDVSGAERGFRPPEALSK
jgi:hypothetical protein